VANRVGRLLTAVELVAIRVGWRHFSTAPEELQWFRASFGYFHVGKEEKKNDEWLIVQAAVDVVTLVTYGSQEWPQAVKAANFLCRDLLSRTSRSMRNAHFST
jgi:hypothetical protein